MSDKLKPILKQIPFDPASDHVVIQSDSGNSLSPWDQFLLNFRPPEDENETLKLRDKLA